MSVINQVLNQLEQRGAHASLGQTVVRAVPPAKRNFTMPLLVFGLVLAAGIAAWQWMESRKHFMNSAKEPDGAAASLAPIAGTPPGTEAPEKTALSQPAATGSEPAASVPSAKPPAGSFVPASRLSFELSSLPRTESKSQRTQNREGHPKKSAAPKAQVAVRASGGSAPMKKVSSAQLADGEFRKAVALMQQGRIADALAGYEAALRLDAGHDEARQALVVLLLENKRGEEAERVLQERLKNKPDHTGFTMLLARLQVDRGAVGEAAATLEKSLPFAKNQADYHAFLAALLQRQNRHEEAITQYRIVTQLAPGNGVWLMGYGISLHAAQRNAEAREAFKKALDTQTLSPDLQAFVQQKLKEL